MKRILFSTLVLVCLLGSTEVFGYCGYGEGVHYSPYALSYYGSGLVPGYVAYSPYAVSYEQSGLVDESAQYTPYALSYYGSGLVLGYGTYPGYCYGDYIIPLFGFSPGRGTHGVSHGVFSGSLRGRRVPPPAHPSGHATPIVRPPHFRSPRVDDSHRPGCDGMEVIRQHLRGRGFAALSIDRILRIDDRLISVDVRVKDRNLLIKYWNPEELARLSAKEASQQRVCAKYQQDWERYAAQYRQAGGVIYTVNASEPQTIVAALDSCTSLDRGNSGQAPTLYAKN